MISATFLKINGQIYSVNCIKQISLIGNAPFKCIELSGIIIFFHKEMDIPPMHFWTHYPEIEQIFYDWRHNKGNLFEIPYLTQEDAEEIDERWKDEIRKEAAKHGEQIEI